MTKVDVFKISGKTKGKIDLPEVFETPYRPDIIKKCVEAARANRRQPYGPSPVAGKQHSEESWSVGMGVSRVPRLSQGRRAVLMPGAVGGRRAHPPTTKRKWTEKINKKEKHLAKASALAATANRELVRKRGHRFEKEMSLPVVVENSLEKINKTSEVMEVFEALGILDDVSRAKEGIHIRSGKGKMRGRKYKIPKSLLVVVSDKTNLGLSARNLPGVDVALPEELNTELLAPGGIAGRFTVFTELSLKKVGELNESI